MFFNKKIAHVVKEHVDIIGHHFVHRENLEETAKIYSLGIYLNLFLPQFAVVMQKTVIHEF